MVRPSRGLGLFARQAQFLELNDLHFVFLLKGVVLRVQTLQVFLDLGDLGLVLAMSCLLFGQLIVGLLRRILLLFGCLLSFFKLSSEDLNLHGGS